MRADVVCSQDPGDYLDLPPVPELILSHEGIVVKTNGSIWQLSETSTVGTKYRINWGLLAPYSFLASRARHLLKLYLADQLTRKKAITTQRMYYEIRVFLRWLFIKAPNLAETFSSQGFNWSDINEGLARAFLEWGVKHTAQKGGHFIVLRAFYEWGVARGYADFQRSLLSCLKPIKAPRHSTGHHVRFRHPKKGPFSSDELFQIRKALLEKKGTDQDRAIVMLHLELGLNPYASIQITNADLKRYENEHLVKYQIDIPRIKKRTIHRETKRRPVSNALGELLEHLQQGDPGDPLLHWLTPSRPERSLTFAMRRFVKATGILSSHARILLHMTPRRFRTSLATHMAAQGASKAHIAEILDHSNLQTVGVYTQTVSSIADQVAEATDSILQPLVRRFFGKIADAPGTLAEQETAQQIPARAPHLPLPMLNAGGIGLCGKKDGLCRLLPPLSCYLCPCFVASRQGPHQEMLDSLLAFLQHGEGMEDDRLKQQLDDVCIAIAEVLAQLKALSPNQSE